MKYIFKNKHEDKLWKESDYLKMEDLYLFRMLLSLANHLKNTLKEVKIEIHFPGITYEISMQIF
jgi:hypothetical protein